MQLKNLLKKLKKKSGFTIVELLVSLLILSMMLVVCTDITVRLMKETRKTDMRSEVDRNINFALETIKRNIRISSTKTIPSCTGNSCSFTLKDSKTFKLDANSQKIIQCTYTTTNPCLINASNPSINLVGDDIVVTSLNFVYSAQDSFVEISVKLYDVEQLVYTQSSPLFITTGAELRIVN